MRRSTGNYSYPYMAFLSLLSLWRIKRTVIWEAESVNNDKSAKGVWEKSIIFVNQNIEVYDYRGHTEDYINR